MIITVSNTLTIENPSAEMQMWCKKHLTLPNPNYAKKARMNLWLGNTPKVLSLYEQRGNTLILPFGTLRTLPDSVKENGGLKNGCSELLYKRLYNNGLASL